MPPSDWTIHRGNVFNLIGFRRRRRSRHRRTVKQEGREKRGSGGGFYQGAREPLFPPEMRPLPSPRNPAPATYSSYQPFLPPYPTTSLFLPSLLAVVVVVVAVVCTCVYTCENRIYIPSLVSPGKYYGARYTHLPRYGL